MCASVVVTVIVKFIFLFFYFWCGSVGPCSVSWAGFIVCGVGGIGVSRVFSREYFFSFAQGRRSRVRDRVVPLLVISGKLVHPSLTSWIYCVWVGGIGRVKSFFT